MELTVTIQFFLQLHQQVAVAVVREEVFLEEMDLQEVQVVEVEAPTQQHLVALELLIKVMLEATLLLILMVQVVVVAQEPLVVLQPL